MGSTEVAPIDRNDRRCTAFHEAGHAVAACVQNLLFERVFIASRSFDPSHGKPGDRLGSVVRNVSFATVSGKPEQAKMEIITSIAGPIAETFAYPNLRLVLPDDHNDKLDAMKFARLAYCKYIDNGDETIDWDRADLKAKLPQLNQAMDEGYQAALDFTLQRRDLITEVAIALLDNGELTFDDVAGICKVP